MKEVVVSRVLTIMQMMKQKAWQCQLMCGSRCSSERRSWRASQLDFASRLVKEQTQRPNVS